MKQNKRTKKFQLWGGRVLFGVYLAGLCYFMFFAENYGREFGEGIYRYNLMPFKEISRFWTYRERLGMQAVVLNLGGNIVGFIPAGYFFPLLKEKKAGCLLTVCLTFELSLLLEFGQLVLKVGSFDVDDLILNTIGGLLGYGLLYIHRKISGYWSKDEE